MNAAQLHERLRLEIARRIDRGLITGTLLARQTGLKPSHISNFLHRKRRLSLTAIDRILAAQSLSVEDLLPPLFSRSASSVPAIPSGVHEGKLDSVPLVSQATAIHSPAVSSRTTIELIRLPAGILDQLRPRRAIIRREWQRFVAVRVSAAQAIPMTPVLAPQAIVVLDRHYNSLASHLPSRPSLYAVNIANDLSFRYVSFEAEHLVLRPYALEHPVELLSLGAAESPSGYIVGRVCICISEL
ncbi:MAG TPA: helix-turn-helix transcriptional regulator [Silvibacterium sp.]|nr:helix-turn-helix transcriptional regulator [Silvibacterium sp.]